MNQSAFVISGYRVGLSEVMLIFIGLFVLFLIVRNIFLYQLKPGRK